MTEMLNAALRYAARGWLVFPVHSVRDARCSCGNVACGTPGKHPAVGAGGVHQGSVDPQMITMWWRRMPEANIGLACGPISRVLVLDIDPRHGGDLALLDLQRTREGEPLPRTLTSLTGGGGQHLFFRWPDEVKGLKNKVNWLPGIDVRGHGAYVVLPPSSHLSGTAYRWDESTLSDGASDAPWELAEVPRDVLELLEHGLSQTNLARAVEPLPPTGSILAGVPEGERDDLLFRMCCRLARQTKDREAVRIWALEMARNCVPPFDEETALRKVEQAWRYFLEDKEKTPDPRAGEKLALQSGEETPEGQPGLRHLSDDGNARRLVDRFEDELRYVTGLGWHNWDDSRWVQRKSKDAMEYARKIALSIYDEARALDDEKLQLPVARWALRSEQVQRLTAVLVIAKSDPRFERTADELDPDPWLLNTPGGVVDLRTGELREPDRKLMQTKQTLAAPASVVRAGAWQRFLDQVLPEQDLQEYVQAAVGYSLTGIQREKCFFIIWGEGDNGKSVFMEVLDQVLGDYAVTTPSSTIIRQRGSRGIPTDLAALRGARFVAASETNEGDRLDEELIKRLTGGDTISARFMRQDFFSFRPQLKLWLATNHKPVVHDLGKAIWDRMKLVPFTQTIPKELQKPRDQLERELLEDGEAVLRWAVDGTRRWRENGLVEPVQVVMANVQYRDEQDFLKEFVEDECVVATGERTPANDIYNRYTLWCLEQGERAMSQRRLGEQLASRGFRQVRSNGKRLWDGLRLREVVLRPPV